jgi:hypothetical protein
MDDYDYEPYPDDFTCDYCTCCTRLGCRRGPDSECPANSDGEYLCPCTEN